jgi:hypothetical protein
VAILLWLIKSTTTKNESTTKSWLLVDNCDVQQKRRTIHSGPIAKNRGDSPLVDKKPQPGKEGAQPKVGYCLKIAMCNKTSLGIIRS